ncbi:MAG: thrombospondin [Sorangium cellulosum]|nr:MAG: thrombospondin [Sorangium cellulosum]
MTAFTSSEAQDIPGSAVGDFRFGLSYALVSRARAYPSGAFALTGRLEISAPTGDEDWFGGERGAVVIPTLSADYRAAGMFVGAEVGARVRETTNLAGARIGTQGFFALGAGYDILPKEMFSAALEAYALPTFTGQQTLSRDPNTKQLVADDASEILIPAEWMATLRSAPTPDGDISFSLSGGSALPLTDSAVTAPLYRFTAAIRFAPLSRDSDGDNVLDRDDQCPHEQEDKDGFEDEDGCVDADNDRDAIPDTLDRCRDKPEDKDGYEDEDGCPDLDDDGDGLEDVKDACRFKPEDKDGFQDDDGCPDSDNDNDGIVDANDRCPNAAEDVDQYNDQDGCPDPDNDGDGIPDEQDKCPLTREDKDGYQDSDGCPERDNDADGIPDRIDQCPTQAETINGKDDRDGCPEAGAKDLTIVNGSTVTVANPQRFLPGSAQISPALRAQLLMMAQRALGIQPVRMIVVQTYADRPGMTERNENLAAKRADAIRRVLIEAGLPEKYLAAAVGDLTSKRAPRSPQFELTVQRGVYK